ncbi:type III-B CRISPR module-associated protein Cmr5 [Thermocladium modestius]|uniref:type III-B CRISPR module-associated protein Cmr5 n=1 Tax=Thermocladium modestius TaxID=62609 RepID=UPI001667C60D|nr:type III-B CRISPR module-associated protein Cmr5 [Thermocladium modestius]
MSSVQVRDGVLDLAVECITAFNKVFGDRDGDKEVRSGFRSRCRDMLTDLYYNGSTYVLSYILSKSSDKNETGLSKLGIALGSNSIEDVFRKLKESGKVSNEAYELYGACLVKALIKLSTISKAGTLIDVINQLNAGNAELLADNKLLLFAVQLKRLAEASIEKPTGD